MPVSFDEYPETDRHNFVRYNPAFLKAVFGREDLLPFWVADTDFRVMPELAEALSARAAKGLFGYETKSPRLKEALAAWYLRRYNLQLNPRGLLFTPSVNTSIAAIIDAFTAPGEGVIIQPPVYQAFMGIIKSLGREIINNPLTFAGNRYEIDFDHLEGVAKVPGTKILLLCSPHNPVGRVWQEEELARIAAICTRHNVLVITDEIHGDIVYPPHQYLSMLTVYARYNDNIIMVSSAGKTFGMPGLVDSFVFTPNRACHKAIKKQIERYHLDKSNAFANTALQTAFTAGDAWLDEMLTYLQGNIDYIASYLAAEIPAIRFPVPEGTYQIWLDFRPLGLSNDELQKFLVEKAGLALNQGYTYGPGGDGFARMNIASPRKMIRQGMAQLAAAVRSL